MTPKAKVLVVDDEKDLVEVISSQLRNGGYEVIAAYGGDEGLQKAIDETPDLIILDIIMPAMDGFQVLQKLRNDPRTSQLPVIMLTQRRDTKDIFKAKELWSTDYITKPFSLEKLLQMVDRYVELYPRDTSSS